MTQEPWLGLEEVRRKRRLRKRWQKVVTALCALVVFCTTYALILPAITLEKGCPIPEHTHTPECYTQLTARQETTLSCAAQLHQHTKGCYDQSNNLVCGYADFLVHTHEENCYDGSGNLRCQLREVKAHSHNENCYAPGHSHGEDCYTRVQGPLICGKHVHTDGCWAETRELSCGLEEGPDHSHGEECYQVTRQLTCGEADHAHGEECYAWDQKLTCTQEETPVLTCREPEIILHRHTESCYDQEGNLVCGMMQILQHQHGEECFLTREIPVDSSALTCGDETHEHGPLCYGQWQLVCPLEEHTHDDRCTPGPEPEETQATEETETTEPTGETEATEGTEATEATEPTGETGATEGTEPTEETEPTGETEPTEETNPTEATEPTEDSDAAKGGDREAVKPTEAEETQATEETEPTEEPESPLPESTPSGLPVLGRAYAAVDPYGIMPLMLEDEEAVLEDRALSNEPVALTNDKIIGAQLEYKDASGQFVDTKDKENIPGNAEFKLTVQYANVPIADLLSAGGKLTYTLPDIFRDAHDNGNIHDRDNQVIGTIVASGQTATVTFKEEWLKQQQASGNQVIGGDFYVQAMVNLTEIPDGGNTTIKIGDVSFTVNFKEHLLAQYGDVTIAKTVGSKVTQDEDGNDYLEYKITVTAGKDGCPVVTVKDTFGEGKGQVVSYVVTGENGTVTTTDVSDTPMTWTIGDMQPYAERTLTYRVKLAPGYTGGKPQGNIQNTATVYSKEYERSNSVATFTPKSNATLRKGCLDGITKLDNGDLELTYYVWVTAQDTNYPLRDVLIKDSLDKSVLQDGYFTDPNLREHIYYKEDSFKLYNGGKYPATEADWTTEYNHPTAGQLRFNENVNAAGKHNGAFEYHVGPLQANESRTLVYKVVVEPGFFTVAGNESKIITNRVAIFWIDEQNQSELMPGQFVYCQKGIDRKAWTRKIAGSPVAGDTDIPMTPGKVYDTNGTTLSNVTSFTVPKGSQQYQVLVNEAGDWDVSQATLTDTLESPLMQFVGYVRVDACEIGTSKPDSSKSDTEALNWFSNKTADETFWVKIDGKQEFSFTPSSFSQEKNYAYRLTYYAKSFSTGSIKVENTFTLSGDVYYLRKRYEKVSISSKTESTVSGDSSFGATKQALFYEAPTTSDSNGFLYWAIRVSGTALPEGFDIQDIPGTGDGLKGHGLTDGSLVGVYTGPNDLSFTDCTTLSDVMEKQLTPVGATKYAVTNNSTVTLNEGIPLGNQSLYILVKTQPEELPTGKRDVFTYQNGFQYSFEDGNWVTGSPASQTLYGKSSIFKELADVFTYDGVNDFNYIYRNTTNNQPRAGYDKTLLSSGEYVGWLIHLNHAGTLQGTYRVEETVPVGLEIAYIRMYWYGKSLSGHPNAEMTTISGLGEGWKPKENTSQGLTSDPLTNHYYVNGQTAIMDVTNLFPGHDTDNYAVELQIVCKLIDTNVLQGGQTKTFANQVKLSTLDGRELDTDVSPVELTAPKMTKKKGDTTGLSGATYPFVITVNENGIDLMPGADTITLEDELGMRLTIDAETIQVTNTNSPETAVTWTSSVETSADGKQTLRIVLPDDKPLTITYTVSVNAPPEQTVTVTNNAHWEGYATTGGSKVEDNTFKVQVGGTAGGDTTPKIKILKLDESNTQAKLAHAEFKLTEMELDTASGKLIEKTGSTPQTGTTDQNGTLTFGESTPHLEYNKVYKIQETKAPDGYVLDEQAKQPYYIVVANKDDSGSYPSEEPYKSLPEQVHFHYSSSTYTHRAYNHKGEITVEKKFAKADGTALDGSLNGTYKFGLYEDAEGNNKVQETSLTYTFGTPTGEAKFKNVTLGQDYYVYELDDNGKAILPGDDAISNKIPFVVSYSGNAITVTGNASTGTVTVTNRINYPELPQTGGVGTGVFRVSGAAAALLAGIILAGREGRKRKRRETNET